MHLLTVSELLGAGATVVLCTLIGLERQLRSKPAGVRTHVLVGLGSCLFTLVSIHGVPIHPDIAVQWDASRIAAQIVSGIGFIGAGLIFINRDAVRGLTTAATVWLAAAIGMACGASMVLAGVLFTALHFLLIGVISPLLQRLPNAEARRTLRIRYTDKRGALRAIMLTASEMKYDATIVSTRQLREGDWQGVEVLMRFRGRVPLRDLIAQLAELDDITAVQLEGRAGNEDDDESTREY